NDAQLPSFPSAGVQTVQAVQDEVIVSLDLAKNRSVSVEDLTPYLAASNEVDPTDPMIVSLAQQVMQEFGDSKDQGELALAMTDFVSAYVTQKDLSQGFATASEVARSKQGDCTEHAVLLAAMLRVAKIPSSVAFGLVYIEDPHSAKRDGFFGFHAWTQALITRSDGTKIWQDFDAAVPSEGGFDAAHILLTTTPLADDAESVPAMLSIVQAIGTIDIEVVEAAP
ncbi:MAG: transglutaminase-like domain-containing protein, partial [Planctomycetota bacterium]